MGNRGVALSFTEYGWRYTGVEKKERMCALAGRERERAHSQQPGGRISNSG